MENKTLKYEFKIMYEQELLELTNSKREKYENVVVKILCDNWNFNDWKHFEIYVSKSELNNNLVKISIYDGELNNYFIADATSGGYEEIC